MADCLVETVSEYLDHVFQRDLDEFYHEIADRRVLFRGQADIDWKLAPSVFRSDEDFLNEHFFIREFERRLPNRCAGKTAMEILLDAQHYGLPTRLLDVTLNPLVALYFACSGCGEGGLADGVVYQFSPSSVFMQDDLTCSIIAEHVRRYKSGQNMPAKWRDEIAAKVAHSDFRFSGDSPRAIRYFLSGEQMCIPLLPKYTNERIFNQEGAFLMYSTPFVMHENTESCVGRFMLPSEVTDNLGLNIETRYIVPAEKKGLIRSQLDRIGFNESRLFPDVEHNAKAIVESVRRTYQGDKPKSTADA